MPKHERLNGGAHTSAVFKLAVTATWANAAGTFTTDNCLPKPAKHRPMVCGTPRVNRYDSSYESRTQGYQVHQSNFWITDIMQTAILESGSMSMKGNHESGWQANHPMINEANISKGDQGWIYVQKNLKLSILISGYSETVCPDQPENPQNCQSKFS